MTSAVDIDDAPHRHELWKLDTNTLVHARITGKFLKVHDPALIEYVSFEGYPIGYEWRLYRQHNELGRWAAPRSRHACPPEHGQVGATADAG